MRVQDFNISFAGFTIRFSLPTQIEIPEALTDFQVQSVSGQDVTYEVQLLKEPLIITEKMLAKYRGMEIYPYHNGILRVYSQLTTPDNKQVACYTDEHDYNILYYPDTRWEYYSNPWNCLHLLGIEEILLRKSAFLLHSSFVQINGKMVLFSGPSGVGKSTQANLWKEHLQAEIINGDRCVVRKIDDTFYGCGSPWAGTSKIYRNKMAPIEGVFILKQGEENSVRRLKAEAFSHIFQQSIINTWSPEFVNEVSNLIIGLLMQVPVYELCCRKDESAVEIAYQTLFGGSSLDEMG